jgi:hypothetical protein
MATVAEQVLLAVLAAILVALLGLWILPFPGFSG